MEDEEVVLINRSSNLNNQHKNTLENIIDNFFQKEIEYFDTIDKVVQV